MKSDEHHWFTSHGWQAAYHDMSGTYIRTAETIHRDRIDWISAPTDLRRMIGHAGDFSSRIDSHGNIEDPFRRQF